MNLVVTRALRLLIFTLGSAIILGGYQNCGRMNVAQKISTVPVEFERIQPEIPAELPSNADPLTNSQTAYGSKLSKRIDGTIMVGERSFFPLGFYHVSWAGKPDDRLKALFEIRKAGFNVMFALVIDDKDIIETYPAFLDSATSEGMYIIPEGMSSAGITSLKNKTSVFGWAVADDANTNFTPAQISVQNQKVKSLDSTHFTYLSMATSFSRHSKEYMGLTDLTGNQSYPINGTDEIAATYQMMSLLVDGTRENGTTPIANLQAFSFEKYPGFPVGITRIPTANEIYNMTYQAVVAGVKGILYYTFVDSYNSPLTTKNSQWNMLSSIAPELNQITPILLDGQFQKLNTEVRDVFASKWLYKNQNYLIIVNSQSSSASVQLKIKISDIYKDLSPMFIGRPTGMHISAAFLVGTRKPLDVHVYKMN